MRRSRKQAHRSGCPIGITLDMLGDPWTLLIVRDLMFKGGKTFGDFLSSGEGIATNILTDRLCRLESNDIVEKRRDPADARRLIYRLSAKGIDLAPVLVEIVLWAASYEKTGAPPHLVEAMRNDKIAFLAQLRAQWQAASSAVIGDLRRPRKSG
ncbi:MAG: helix-turn-helix domain-containing protein [Steroidobacteraceae bacterium]